MSNARWICALLALATLLATATAEAARSAPRQRAAVTDSWIEVEFSGSAWAQRTFEKVTAVASDTFREWYSVKVEDRSGRVNSITPPVQALVSSGPKTWTNTVMSCASELHQVPADLGTEGVRVWFSWDRGVFPDPGAHNVLVTAPAPWSGTSTPVSGIPTLCGGGMEFFTLSPYFEHTLMCVVRPGRTCNDFHDFPLKTGGGNGRVDTGFGSVRVVARSSPTQPDQSIPPFVDTILTGLPPSPNQWQWTTSAPPSQLLVTRSAPVSGSLTGRVTIGGKPLIQITGTLRKGARPQLALKWSPSGLAVARRGKRPATVTTTMTLTPAAGAPVTAANTAYLVPAPRAAGASQPSGGTITSVTFAGTKANPAFVVHGRNLGSKPPPNPAQHPSGLNGCPAVAGDNGYLYGTSLYIAVPARNWAGGRYRPSLNETDCIDLVVTKFTPTQVTFHFGPFYAKYSAQYPLVDGDAVEVAVNSAVKTVHFKTGATVTS